MQVDLKTHLKNSQYLPQIVYGPPREPQGLALGKTSCGLVAVSSHWRTPAGPNLNLLRWLKEASGSDYSAGNGMQPTPLYKATAKVFGAIHTRQYTHTTFKQLYDWLRQGRIVIVDLIVRLQTINGSRYDSPGNEGTTGAHFARVLGVDLNNNQLYLESSLYPDSVRYWKISFQDYMDLSTNPENRATILPTGPLETVTQWALTISTKATPTEP